MGHVDVTRYGFQYYVLVYHGTMQTFCNGKNENVAEGEVQE